MLRLLVRNNNFKRFCHTHSKTNFCKFNEKTVNVERLDKLEIDRLEMDILFIKKCTMFSYFINLFTLPFIIMGS